MIIEYKFYNGSGIEAVVELSLVNGDKFIVTGCLYGSRVDRSYQGNIYEVVHVDERDMPFILVRAIYEEFSCSKPGKIFALNVKEWQLKKPSDEYVNALIPKTQPEIKTEIH